MSNKNPVQNSSHAHAPPTDVGLLLPEAKNRQHRQRLGEWLWGHYQDIGFGSELTAWVTG